MRNTILIAFLAITVLAGCATQWTRTDWRRHLRTTVDIKATTAFLEDAGILQCIDGDRDEIAKTYYKDTFDCLYEVSGKMPETVNYSQSAAYAQEADNCALIKFSKKYLDAWSLTNVPRDKHQRCLELYQGMESLSKID